MRYTINPGEDGVLLIGCTNHHYKVTVKKDLKYANKINRRTSLDFRNIWRVEDELELYSSLSEAIDRAKEILKKKILWKIRFIKYEQNTGLKMSRTMLLKDMKFTLHL